MCEKSRTWKIEVSSCVLKSTDTNLGQKSRPLLVAEAKDSQDLHGICIAETINVVLERGAVAAV